LTVVEIPPINMDIFDYALPQEKIAQFPVDARDQSKLLVYRNGNLQETRFVSIDEFLPTESLLVYNQTRVIRARLNFGKDTGAHIEIFCLEPVLPTRETQQAFECSSGVTWKCLVGNSKRWKSGKLSKSFTLNKQEGKLYAERVQRSDDHSLVEFTWEPGNLSFSEVLEQTGSVPLPPYMHRDATLSDSERYQTVFARDKGSVAAPTAGLHFTDAVFKKLRDKKIRTAEVTLHVGAGTFKPVSSNDIREHEMHTEKIIITRETIKTLMQNERNKVIVTGTTTMRTLESLYLHGAKLLLGNASGPEMEISQWDPYGAIQEVDIPTYDSLQAVLNTMDQNGIDEIHGETQLMIVPGFRFRIADMLITNFHMPRSTLLLLVAAFMGKDWEKAYNYALSHDFRFLSYGDACLFFKSEVQEN